MNSPYQQCQKVLRRCAPLLCGLVLLVLPFAARLSGLGRVDEQDTLDLYHHILIPAPRACVKSQKYYRNYLT